jgi:hypothetical protein
VLQRQPLFQKNFLACSKALSSYTLDQSPLHAEI